MHSASHSHTDIRYSPDVLFYKRRAGRVGLSYCFPICACVRFPIDQSTNEVLLARLWLRLLGKHRVISYYFYRCFGFNSLSSQDQFHAVKIILYIWALSSLSTLFPNALTCRHQAWLPHLRIVNSISVLLEVSSLVTKSIAQLTHIQFFRFLVYSS